MLEIIQMPYTLFPVAWQRCVKAQGSVSCQESNIDGTRRSHSGFPSSACTRVSFYKFCTVLTPLHIPVLPKARLQKVLTRWDSSCCPFMTVLVFLLSPTLILAHHKSVLCFLDFVISKTPCEWKIITFWGLLFFTQHNSLEIHPSCCVCVGNSFFMTEKYSVGVAGPQFTSPLLKGSWADSGFQRLQIKLL